MKKILFSLLSLFFLLFSANPASAHVTKTFNDMDITMHINPDDDPIAGPDSMFLIKIEDKNNNFKLENCNCRAAIYENGKEIFTTPLSANNIGTSLYDAVFVFPFAKKNTYQIEITGQPFSGANFEPFKATFDVRVAREDKTATAGTIAASTPEFPLIPVSVGAIFAFFGLIFLFKAFNGRGKIKLLVFIFLFSFLSINLTPLELFPHQHDGTELPTHNKFLFVPKTVTHSEIILVEPQIVYFYQAKLITGNVHEKFLQITPNNKSPPA